MSGTEDYLDGLLNSISEKDLDTKKKTGSETMQTEEDIMNDMENDLLSKEAEDNCKMRSRHRKRKKRMISLTV